MPSDLSAQLYEELKKNFNEVDTNGDGLISEQELYTLMSQLLEQNSDVDVGAATKKAFNKVDTNHDGYISFDEYVALYQSAISGD